MLLGQWWGVQGDQREMRAGAQGIRVTCSVSTCRRVDAEESRSISVIRMDDSSYGDNSMKASAAAVVACKMCGTKVCSETAMHV